MPGVRTAWRELMSDHANCNRPAYRPNVSGLLRNGHLIVRMWQKRVHIRCMPIILKVASLTTWGLTVGHYRLELKINYVVVGIVGKWL